MDPLTVTIQRWAAWAPGLASRSEWQAWAEGRRSIRPGEPPDASRIPPLLRRRLSPLGKMALAVAWTVLPGDEAEPSIPAVFASRHGELARTVGMLQALNRGESLSPTQFSLSVHNAISGVFSIARKNTGAITALALNLEGPSLALLEATLILGESAADRVLCVIYDEPLPQPYAQKESGIGPAIPYAVAFLLSSDAGKGDTLALSFQQGGGPQSLAFSDEPSIFALLRYLLAPRARQLVLPGLGHHWQWSRSSGN